LNSRINLERSLAIGARLDGHMVQGHVDTVANCISKNAKDGSVEFQFKFDDRFAELIIEKGSICVNGISLTVFNVGRNDFRVAIIPFTITHTNIDDVTIGDWVNIEFDVFGKYLQRKGSLRNNDE
jgi:riboflavin synthase